MVSDQRTVRKSIWLAWVLLSAGLIATIVATIFVKKDVEADAKREFNFACSQIQLRIDTRMDAHAQILTSAAALFDVSDVVTREQWHDYILRQKVQQRLPGIQGVGFSLMIPPERLEQHIREIRSQGFPEYNVKPEGDRKTYTAIIYLEPFSGRNLRAFGYDMFSEPVRRMAMERAMDLDVAAHSGKVLLVQETGQDVQAGNLLYVPVYRKGMSTDTIDHRRAALYGWVYSPYRMKDLMQGILSGGDLDARKRIRLQIFDNEQLSADSLLYDSQPKGEMETVLASRLAMQTPMAFSGHLWYLRFTQADGQSEYGLVYGVLSGGTIISLLLFGLFSSLLNIRFKVQQQVDQLTVDLRESEQSYRNQFTHNSAVMLLIDPADGAIIDANSAATGFYGYPREQLLAMHITDINTLSASEVRQSMASFTPKQGKEFNFQHRLADGSVRDVEVFSSRIQFAGRTVLHSIIHDITKRKEAEEKLRQAADRLTLAARAGGVGIWDYDVVNNKLIWDEQMFRLYGITQGQFCGAYEAWQAGVHPEDRLRGDEEIQLALRGEKDFNTEFRVLWPDGTIRNLRALALVQRDASGQPLHMIGTNWDITAQKLAENALRESEALQRLLLTSLPTGVIIVDPVTRIIEQVNDHVATLFGARVDHLVGQRCHSLLCPADEGACPVCDLGQAVDNSDRVMLRADGSRLSILKTVKRVHLKGQEKLLECFIDVSERKRVEAELQEVNRYLEEATARANHMAAVAEIANAAKSEFLANMSHEIRTPMNGVIGMTGLLLDTELNDEQRRYAEIVRSSGESLLGLINDILDFSKVEAKKLDLETLDFDLSSLLDDFASTLAMRAHEKGLELLCAADLDVPTLLRGDPGRLRQILTNLAGNAVKFTPTGEVAVRVSVLKEGAGDREQGAGGQETVLLRFSVRDTGIGIPKDKIGLLFGKFSQVDASTTRQYGGTGLGLAISKQLAELMGGEAGVNSEEGKGSEFWFTARLGKQTGDVHMESTLPADLQKVRVLIVDDNATNCKILNTRLAFWGMRPTVAMDGPGAIQALNLALDENDPFRIAVIDMQMPGMDGETLGRIIQADKRLNDTRMVMLTSLGTRGDARRLEEIGFAGYATKPIRHQELKAILSLAVGDRDKSTQRPIATRHTAREALNLFAGRKARILLAEDNITNQQVALGILKKLGLRADAVANGAEALKALETLPYDLVLMDVQMPEMNGFEATRRIRNRERKMMNDECGTMKKEKPATDDSPSSFVIPIIAMTAHSMQGDRERCMEAGMNDYITKPVSPQALAEVLDKWLPKEEKIATFKIEPGEQSPPSFKSQIPVFDKAGMMARLMDDEDLAQMVVEGFLEDIPRQIAALKGYLKTGDAAGTERQAHTIKGASANVGGERLLEVAFEMEKSAKAGDLSAVVGHMVELEAQFNLLNQAMTEEP